MTVAWILAGAGRIDGDRPVGGRSMGFPEEFIPKNVRRRLSRLILQALQVTFEAADPGIDAPLVFGTANGEIETIAMLLPAVLAPDPSVSPTLFHNSVHNAAPGYWAILARRLAASTTVTAGPATFEAALLEAVCRLEDGAPQVQVTAGDEAIRGALWADPEHCTQDFCGSLRLASRPPEGGRSLGAIESLRLGLPEDFPVPDGEEEVRVFDRNDLPGGASHPCGSLHPLLEFLLGPPGARRLRMRRTLANGTMLEAVFRRESGFDD
ncbi:beta-ketoacyl synthase chain length factor [Myxococcota bacterium]|nr:beta-ketoacyl synthase chain length factor [Myxococcota bacterium]